MLLAFGRQKGAIVVLALLLIPALLVLIGIVVDGALLARQQVSLEGAVDAAARAAADAYDRTVWAEQHQVVIDPVGAEALAGEYLRLNMPEARLRTVYVDATASNVVFVDATVTVRFFFIRIVGINEKELYAFSEATKS